MNGLSLLGGGVPNEMQVLGTQIGVGLSDTGGNAASNLLLSTQNFNSADWLATHCTVADNILTAPDSTTTAASITEDTAANVLHPIQQGYSQVAGATQYTFSIYLHTGGRSRAYVQVGELDGSSYAYVDFDIAGVQIGVAAGIVGGWSGASATINSSTNGFVRGTLTFTTASTTTNILVAVMPDAGSGTGGLDGQYTGNGSLSIYVWGAQLITGSAAGTYTSITNAGSAATVLNDGNLTNYWGTQTVNAWVGVDAGQSMTWTRYRFTPRPGGSSPLVTPLGLDYETYMQGVPAQVSSSSTFASGNTTIDTVPTTPYYARFNLNERTLPQSPTGRYIRLLPASTSYGSISELQFFAKYNSSVSGCPVAPVISPWGGRFPSGSAVVTLTSLTQTASIYYTTDGSTPSNTNGTLYSGPFTYSSFTTSTLKAVAYDPALSTPLSPVSSGIFNNYGIAPKDDWYDNRGILIEAHGGGIIYVGGLYYWCGAILNKYAPPYNPNPSVGNIIRNDVGVLMYSSPDLLNWTFVGNILSQPSNTVLCERPHILYNAANNNYVLWAHGATSLTVSGSDNFAMIATSSSITGPWSWVNTAYHPNGTQFEDNSLFVDPVDGVTAYIVYVSTQGSTISITQLASDYQSATASTVGLATGQREGCVLFKNSSGTYFMLSSVSNFYHSDLTMGLSYITSTAANPLSGWSTPPGTSISISTSSPYNAQPSFILTPNGHTQPFLGADWWQSGTNLYGSRQSWMPITFPTSTTMALSQPTNWTPSSLS